MEVTPDQIEQINASVNAAMVAINEQLNMWIDLITEAMHEVRNNPVLTHKEVTVGLRELGRTRQILLSERDRHLQAFGREAGYVQESIIDFETERISIAGKLDRLRAAGSSESISQ